jgi:hypothetical protein
MTHRIFPIVFALSTLANLFVNLLVKPAAANEKPYPELMLRSLVEVCVKENPKGILVPFSRETKTEKTLPAIITEYETVVNQSIETVKQNRLDQEKAIKAQVQQHLLQLQAQVKDKTKLKLEIQQIQDLIAKGAANGQNLELEQIEQLKKSLQDLIKLEQDPTYLQIMAKTTQDEELSKLQKKEMTFITEATKGLTKIQRCGCTIDRIQKRHSIDELGDRIKLNMTGKDGILNDVRESYGKCP